MWHIITNDINEDDLNHVYGDAYKVDQNCKISKWLSDYILYLLLFCLSMLSSGIGEISYDHTHVNAERTCAVPSSKHECRAKKGITSGNCRHSLFEQTIGHVSQLKDNENGGKIRWEVISEVWLELLAYGAQNCEWKEYAQHLRKGGELLTQVSVLMVNFHLHKLVM
ncbi:hypothetical protein ACOSQ4_019898 [Xanthoceras sorbifolium]